VEWQQTLPEFNLLYVSVGCVELVTAGVCLISFEFVLMT
jgi:hypothetical protein